MWFVRLRSILVEPQRYGRTQIPASPCQIDPWSIPRLQCLSGLSPMKERLPQISSTEWNCRRSGGFFRIRLGTPWVLRSINMSLGRMVIAQWTHLLHTVERFLRSPTTSTSFPSLPWEKSRSIYGFLRLGTIGLRQWLKSLGISSAGIKETWTQPTLRSGPLKMPWWTKSCWRW